MASADQTTTSPPLSVVEAWAQAHLDRRLSIRLRNSEAGWFFMDMRGALEEAARGGNEEVDLTLELKLEGDQKIILHAEQIVDTALHEDSIRIQCRIGDLEIEADSL